MTDRYRAAVDIQDLHRYAELTPAIIHLHRECLVQLPQVDVVHFLRPVRSGNLGTANTGPMPISTGLRPSTARPRIRNTRADQRLRASGLPTISFHYFVWTCVNALRARRGRIPDPLVRSHIEQFNVSARTVTCDACRIRKPVVNGYAFSPASKLAPSDQLVELNILSQKNRGISALPDATGLITFLQMSAYRYGMW
jgi:hypothetical protein